MEDVVSVAAEVDAGTSKGNFEKVVVSVEINFLELQNLDRQLET